MNFVKPVIIALSFLSFQAAVAQADEATPPKATATRPAKEPVGQTSLPNDAAPPMTSKQTTGSNAQDPTTKRMNEEGLQKLKVEGK